VLDAGAEIYQSYLGSSTNPGYRHLAVAAEIIKGRRVADGVSFDVNPASRQALAQLIGGGRLTALMEAGARVHPPVATASSVWAKPRLPAAAACAPCRATSLAAPAAWRTRCTCAAPNRSPPPRSPA
jgi:homoaconitase/3-isopropylmalate dehydratase large subunit